MKGNSSKTINNKDQFANIIAIDKNQQDDINQLINQLNNNDNIDLGLQN